MNDVLLLFQENDFHPRDVIAHTSDLYVGPQDRLLRQNKLRHRRQCGG